MAHLLLWQHATVTVCHSRSCDLDKITREADLIVVAVGKPKMVKSDWIKPGAIVIDCGISSVADSTKKSGKALLGDVDYEGCSKVAGWITPVPGGVGPMTVAMLLHNTVQCAVEALQQQVTMTVCNNIIMLTIFQPLDGKWHINYLPLNLVKPVPSDIAIARAQQPKDIAVLANEIGLLPAEVKNLARKVSYFIITG